VPKADISRLNSITLSAIESTPDAGARLPYFCLRKPRSPCVRIATVHRKITEDGYGRPACLPERVRIDGGQSAGWGTIRMMLNRDECRQRANECRRNAAQLADAVLRETYLDLARRWSMMAQQAESLEKKGETKKRRGSRCA